MMGGFNLLAAVLLAAGFVAAAAYGLWSFAMWVL
jgi:hypothetical protein